jgi:hypothetical protein
MNAIRCRFESIVLTTTRGRYFARLALFLGRLVAVEVKRESADEAGSAPPALPPWPPCWASRVGESGKVERQVEPDDRGGLRLSCRVLPAGAPQDSLEELLERAKMKSRIDALYDVCCVARLAHTTDLVGARIPRNPRRRLPDRA